MQDIQVSSIKDVASEAGIIATLVLKPDFYFLGETLTPNDFTDEANAYIYYAIGELAKRDVTNIDAYNITNILQSKKATAEKTKDLLTINSLTELIETAPLIARQTPEEYVVLVQSVTDKAFRRDLHKNLSKCLAMCSSDNEKIETDIYNIIDSTFAKYATHDKLQLLGDVIDELWQQVEDRQNGKCSVVPTKFNTLNGFIDGYEAGELIVFGGSAKAGKSMMMLNCAVDMLTKGHKVLYIDTEINDRQFILRLLSHLSKIPFDKIKNGRCDDKEKNILRGWREWLKKQPLIHKYMPAFEAREIYIATKKAIHTAGVDTLIVDYIKDTSDGDAYSSYKSIGAAVDLLKNEICGKLDIYGIAAAQCTDSGRLSDSAKIARNATNIILIRNIPKDVQEERGLECGNKELFVQFNRYGNMMYDGDIGITLNFNGAIASFEEAKQPTPNTPY